MSRKTEHIKIYSENNYFQYAETLKRNRTKRHQSHQFFVEWVKSINLAIEYGWIMDSFLYTTDRPLSSWAQNLLDSEIAKKHIEMPKVLMDKLSDKEDGSELIAIIEMRDDNLWRIKIHENLFVVVLDRAASPGNLGTIIRSCNSFGVDAVIMTGHSVDLYDPKTLQSSVGTIFSTDVIRLESHSELSTWLEKIKINIGSIHIIGTTVRTDAMIDQADFKTPLVLLIGNETSGLSANYKDMCDELVKIPIHWSASSLNVGCATSIFLYEASKHIR